MEEGSDDVSNNQKERMRVPHVRPGIMLLTASMQLLHKDLFLNVAIRMHS